MAIGIVTFPGISAIVSADFTLSHGVTPSVAHITIAPQADISGLSGTLAFHFGQTTIEFKDCKLDKTNFQRTSTGLIWSLDVFDRRWKWANRAILGRYNTRKANGLIDVATEKTPQQLARLCLDAMKESGYDVSALPNDARPEIEWDYENPAQALDDLCETLGCSVVLGLNNKVSIKKIGAGKTLPTLQELYSDSLTLDVPERPDGLMCVGGIVRWQDRFKLEAVGLDTDGKVKLVDKLSYKPANGWATADPDVFGNVEDDDARKLAKQTVWRWYRVTKLQDNTLIHPIWGDIEKVENLLPLESGLVTVHTDPDGTEKQDEAVVTGRFYDENGTGNVTDFGTKYKEGFSIDGEAGIVKFSAPVFYTSGGDIEQARLFLDCAHVIRGKSGLPIRYTREDKFPGKSFNAGLRVIKHEDLVRTVYFEYDPTTNAIKKTHDNMATVAKQAEPYLTAAASEYFRPPGNERAYRGLVAIEPDGNILQVTWSVGVSGGASTKASSGQQHNPWVPSIKDRRAMARLKLDNLRAAKEKARPAVRKREDGK